MISRYRADEAPDSWAPVHHWITSSARSSAASSRNPAQLNHTLRQGLHTVTLARDRPSMPQASGDDGLAADPEPAKAVSANRAAEAEGHEDDGEDHDHPVDQRLPDVEARQQLGQDDQETRSQHGAEQGGEAAEDDD